MQVSKIQTYFKGPQNTAEIDRDHARFKERQPLVQQMRTDGVSTTSMAFIAGQLHAENRAEALKMFFLAGQMDHFERAYALKEVQ